MPDTVASVPATFTNNVGNGWNSAVTFDLPTPGSDWISGFWDVEYAISQPWFNPTSGVGITLTGGLLAYDGEKNSGRYQFPVTSDQLAYINAHQGMTINANVTGHANAGPAFSLCTLNLVESGGSGGQDGGGGSGPTPTHDFNPTIRYIPGYGIRSL